MFWDKVDNTSINDACNGFVLAIDDMLGKLFEAMKKDEFNFGNNDHRIMLCNSRLLLALRVKFSYDNNEYYRW